MKWFNKQSRVLQILLLVIPGLNWLTEIFVRVTACLQNPKISNILGFILALLPPTGIILGYVDLVWVLLYNKLFWAD